jgi:hypothetical protein
MASAFWGGFADTLKDIRLEDRAGEKEMERQDALMRMKEKYQAKIVDSQQTTIEGTTEVRRNQFGDVISRRELSPEEADARKAQLAKTQADAARSTAEAGISAKSLETFDDDRRVRLEESASVRAAREANVAQGWAGVANASKRLSLDEARLGRAEADLVTSTLFEAGDLGDVSAMSLLEEYDRELTQATDEKQRQRVIAKYLGTAKNRLMQVKQQMRGTQGGTLPATVPEL